MEDKSCPERVTLATSSQQVRHMGRRGAGGHHMVPDQRQNQAPGPVSQVLSPVGQWEGDGPGVAWTPLAVSSTVPQCWTREQNPSLQ